MEEPRNAEGLTEAEFLAAYDVTKFERPSVTVDIILLDGQRVLLIRRGNHPAIGKLAFPGGFVEPDEDCRTAALRELYEETSLSARDMVELPVASAPKRDPRTRIITVPFAAKPAGDPALAAAGDDARDAEWFDFTAYERDGRIKITLSGATEKHCFYVKRIYDENGIFADPTYLSEGENPLAGDHAALLACALDRMNKIHPGDRE